MSKGKKASARDAQVLMQLYDLRREPVMRQARKFMVSEFWPQSHEEFKALLTEFGSERNAWARQCLTYWDMAAAVVLHGALDENLFFACNVEPYLKIWVLPIAVSKRLHQRRLSAEFGAAGQPSQGQAARQRAPGPCGSPAEGGGREIVPFQSIISSFD